MMLKSLTDIIMKNSTHIRIWILC